MFKPFKYLLNLFVRLLTVNGCVVFAFCFPASPLLQMQKTLTVHKTVAEVSCSKSVLRYSDNGGISSVWCTGEIQIKSHKYTH